MKTKLWLLYQHIKKKLRKVAILLQEFAVTLTLTKAAVKLSRFTV